MLTAACVLNACAGDPASQRDLQLDDGTAGTAAAPGGSAMSPGAPMDFGQPGAAPTPTGTGTTPAAGSTPGSAGAAAAATPGAGIAAPVPDAPPPERTGVIFDWPEADPNATASCKPGHYVGEYACRLYIIDTSGEGAFDVSGTIDMQLEQTPDGELLRIADGHFASATLAAIPMSADIVGELDCTSGRFEGRLENGLFSVALGLPIPFTVGTFSGPLHSDYDHDAAALEGAWDMMGELDGFPGTCMGGSWSASWVP